MHGCMAEPLLPEPATAARNVVMLVVRRAERSQKNAFMESHDHPTCNQFVERWLR